MTFETSKCLTVLDVEMGAIDLNRYEYYGIAADTIGTLKRRVETVNEKSKLQQLLSVSTATTFPFELATCNNSVCPRYNLFYLVRTEEKKPAQFLVTIREVLEKSVIVSARSQEEAADAVRAAYRNEDIVLSAENYVDTEISAEDYTDTTGLVQYDKLEDILQED